MTKEEFIGRAAHAILRNMGYPNPDDAPGARLMVAVADATAALEAVGAWTAWCRLEEIRDEHAVMPDGRYCKTCDEIEGPNYPCSTRRIAEAHVGAR